MRSSTALRSDLDGSCTTTRVNSSSDTIASCAASARLSIAGSTKRRIGAPTNSTIEVPAETTRSAVPTCGVPTTSSIIERANRLAAPKASGVSGTAVASTSTDFDGTATSGAALPGLPRTR